ncbi:DUF4932 domain-containing protein [Candidatus Latescibacterota bacterium]
MGEKMNYMIKAIPIILIFLNTALCFGQSNIDSYFINNQFKEYKYEINGVEISIDPRIEFWNVMNFIAGNPNINTTEMDYKLEIIQYFNKYKNHSFREYFRTNFMKFFPSIDEPYNLLLSLNNDFTFRENLINNSWENVPEIETLLQVMRTFLADTDFVTFFNNQGAFYKLVLNDTVFTLNDFNEKRRMLDYYGIKNANEHKFCLILSSLGFGNFGQGITTTTHEEHYAIISPNCGNGSIPFFDNVQALALIWHEFGHSFTNPLVDKYWDDFENISYLHEPIEQSMKGQAYHEWRSVVYEHLVRAATCRLGALKYSEDYAEVNLNRIEMGRKFIYTVPIISTLKEYEQNRDRYPTLDSYMPNIIKTMKGVNKDSIETWLSQTQQIREPNISDIPTNGEVYNRKNQLLILSTHEDDTTADEKLKEYITQTHANYTIVADTTALNMDLSDFNLFAIGTPWGNKFIEKYITLLPIKMTREGLIAKNVYEGNGYAFLTGWINPSNPENTMTIYTAQNPDNLVNFSWVPKGSTDYQIVKDLITLKAADYERYAQIWGCY